MAVTAARYAVGIVHYRTYDDLERCIASIESQSLLPERIVIVDADADLRELELLRNRHPEVQWEPIANRGFAVGANLALERLQHVDPKAEFFLILNPDVELEPHFARILLSEMTNFSQAALA